MNTTGRELIIVETEWLAHIILFSLYSEFPWKKVKNRKLSGPDEFYLIFTGHTIPICCQLSDHRKRGKFSLLIVWSSIPKH